MPSLMRKLNVISRCEGLYRGEKLQNGELAPCHHSFVFAICLHRGMSQEQLAKHICLSKSAVTRTLAHLESLGYVTRVPSETDKRVMLVYPTEKMENIFPTVRAISGDWNDLLLEEIEEGEREIFFRVLEKLEERAKALTDGGGK